jgi:hypothetical protein
VAIVRPSFIGAVAGAPCPGYVGNLAGNNPVCINNKTNSHVLAAAAGLMYCFKLVLRRVTENTEDLGQELRCDGDGTHYAGHAHDEASKRHIYCVAPTSISVASDRLV